MSEQSPLNDYVENVTSIKSKRDKIKIDIDTATTKQQVVDIWNGRTYKYYGINDEY